MRKFQLGSVAMAAALTAQTATAQTAPGEAAPAVPAAATAAQSDGLSDIVVTANRKSRAETLQSVAVSVSAFSGAQLEAQHAVTLSDVGRLTPGARLESNGTFPAAANFYVRGVGINTTNPSDDPTVGVFVDGMYLGVNIGALTDLFDVESVEILRGPQGTLFGRNVTGGAVLVRSKRPTGEFAVRGEAQFGSFKEADGRISIEGPLIQDTLNAKLAVMYNSHDGYFSNAASPSDRIGKSNALIVKPILEWKPSSTFTATLIAELGNEIDRGTPTKNLLIKPSANLTPAVPTGDFDLTENLYSRTRTEWRQVIGEGVLDVGTGKITATASYRTLKVDDQTEIDGTTAPLFQFNSPTGLRQHQVTGELLYAGQIGDAIDLTFGGNIFSQHMEYQENRTTASNANIATGGSSSAGRGIEDHTAGGIFAQADWRFAQNLTLTLGGRYTIEHKHAQVANFGQCSLTFSTCNYGTDDGHTWRDFTPKAGVKWQPTKDLTIYGSYTRGFRSGGYNLRNSVGLAGPYDPENVDAYEIGIKSQLFDRHVRANVSLYRNDFTNLQRQVLTPQAQQRVINAASARIQGVEGELTIVPVRGLSLGGTLAYTDAKYNSYNGLDLTGDGIPDPVLAAQLKLTRVPKWTYSLTGSYETAVGSAGTASLNVAYDHTDSRALNETNTYFLSGYGLLNASIGFTTADKKYKLSIFAKNLTNTLYATTGVDIGTFRSVYIGAPRTYGVTAGFSF
ncbi:TonB-dependent receptor [Sphingomonas oligophenolica]|uniref:TonB-dependent receptor n=1 Tax=Sphingomonas oligophenolica TaxID=301154 RepID=A0ABU9Y1D4_9SPHN